MTSQPNRDGNGVPELAGTRLTVHHLFPYFLDPTATEAYICRVLSLTPEQVAAARAFVLRNPEDVLARYVEIEERIATGNPPEVIARAEGTRAAFRRFKERLDQERRLESTSEEPQRPTAPDTIEPVPTFREWLSQQSSLL